MKMMTKIKCQRWKMNLEFFLYMLIVFKITEIYGESYNFKCPSQVDWKIRAQVKCNSTLKYFCLYNSAERKYVEGCNGPDWDRKGSKRIYSGDFSRGKCLPSRFQPFTFWTNGSMSDCFFSKSFCSEEGQLVYMEKSSRTDRTCRCDYKKSYSFIKTPRNVCYCIPTEEDCSCYVKLCPINFTLSADYSCIQSSLIKQTKCTDMKEYNRTVDENTRVVMGKEEILMTLEFKLISSTAAVVCSIVLILIIGVVFLTVLFHTRTVEKRQFMFEHIKRKLSSYGVLKLRERQVDAETTQLRTPAEQNYLRMIHLLFRVVCPVVRIYFNHEIHPSQLRRTLDKNRSEMVKRYRGKEKLINDYQWNLLFRHSKVTSENFDIKLMKILLYALGKIYISDSYQVKSVNSYSAMLSVINYNRNTTVRRCDGQLSNDKFIECYNNIGQAVLTLMSLKDERLHISCDQEKIRLIGRLLALNPIYIDVKKMCRFIDMSERYPAMILEKIISEYCGLKNVSIQYILIEEKHQIYHNRIKTEACCKCSVPGLHPYIKHIPEKQWKSLYEKAYGSTMQSCPSNLKTCIESYIPKKINTDDLSVSMSLIQNSQNMVNHIMSRICENRFDTFLMEHKHTLYHNVWNMRCCRCNKAPTKQRSISEDEWNTLYQKDNNIICKTIPDGCCCHFSFRNDIKYSDIDDTLLSKIFRVAGPIGVFNNIPKNAFLCFLHWTADDKKLLKALTDLLGVIDDKQFCHKILSSIQSQSDETIAENTIADENDAHMWVTRHMQQPEATTERLLRFLVPDKDGLKIKSVQIPKDFPLPNEMKKITDVTDEENNILMVYFGFKKVVYPVITKEYLTKCNNEILYKIRMELYDQQTNCNEKTSRKKGIYLTQNQQHQLFSPTKEESMNLGLELMICILKWTANLEGQTDYVDQLDIISGIQREIEESSTGVLNEQRYHEIMHAIRKAVLHFGKEYEGYLVHLLHIKHILD